MINANGPFQNYILINKLSNKLIRLKIDGMKHFFLVDKNYFLISYKNDFTLKEKLYILNLPLDVAWCPVSKFSIYLIKLFLIPVSPTELKIDAFKGKIKIYIDKISNFKGA